MKSLAYISLIVILLALCMPQRARRLSPASAEATAAYAPSAAETGKAGRQTGKSESELIKLFDHYYRMADTCFMRQDFTGTHRNVVKALDISKQMAEPVSTSHLLTTLYQANVVPFRTNKNGINLVDNAVKRAHDYANRIAELPQPTTPAAIAHRKQQEQQAQEGLFEAYIFKAILYGQHNADSLNYREACANYHRYATAELIQKYSSYYWRAESYEQDLRHNIDSVIILRQRIADPLERQRALFSVYMALSDWPTAKLYADSIDKMTRTLDAQIQQVTSAEMEKLFLKNDLDIETAEQNAALQEAEANQRSALLEQQRVKMESERTDNEKRRLQLEKDNHDRQLRLDSATMRQRQAEWQHKSMEHRALLAQQERESMQMTMLTWAAVVAILLALAAFMAWWVRSGHRQMQRVRDINDSLRQTRDEALEAARKKDEFIAGMNDDITVPLDELALQAHKLTDPNATYTDEERMEIGQRAQEAGTRIVDYVNNVLHPADNASLSTHERDEKLVEETRRRLQHSRGAALSVIVIMLAVTFIQPSAAVLSREDQNSQQQTLPNPPLGGRGYQHLSPTTQHLSPTTGPTIGDQISEHTPALAIVSKKLPLWGQGGSTNPYKIDDEVYRRFVKFRGAVKDSAKVFAMGNELLRFCQQRNEKKGYCMTLSYLMQWIENNKRNMNYHPVLNLLREKSKEYGYMQYYYNSYYQEANLLRASGKISAAVIVINKMEREVEKTGNPYGKYYYYMARAMLSDYESDPAGLVMWEKKMIEANELLETKQDISSRYLDILRHTPNGWYSAEGKHLLQKALQEARTQNAKVTVYCDMAYYAILNHDTLHFREYSDIAAKLLKGSGDYRPIHTNLIFAYDCALRGRLDSAYYWLNRMSSKLDRIKYSLVLAEHFNDIEKALTLRDKLNDERS